jgi:hypothetical protein
MTLLAETLTEAERAECNTPSRRTITGFTRYSQAIPSTELPKVDELASLIRASHQPGNRPIRRIRLVGHADLDNARGRDFENRISAERARTVERALRERLPKPVADRLQFEIVARGSSRRCVLNPVNETDRMRNRRVEIFTALGAKPTPKPPSPFCGGMPATAPPVELKALRVLAQTVLESIPRPLRLGIKPPTALRFLYRAERTEAEKVFRGSLDYSRILLSDGLGMEGRPFTIAVSTAHGPFVIILIGDTNRCWSSLPQSGDLIHELTHAWQSQHHRDSTAFMANSVKCQAAALADLPIAKAAAAKNAVAAAVRRGEFNPEVLKRIGIQAAQDESTSSYAYVPGRAFGLYGAEQIAQQVEDHHKSTGRPTPGVLSVIGGKPPGRPVPENTASLDVISFHRKSTPGVVFR